MSAGEVPVEGVVSVQLLGGVRITAGTDSLDGRALGRRGEIVLARLALGAGSEVSREVLADAVWGFSLPTSWRGSLRNVMSALHAAIDKAELGRRVTISTFEGRSRLDLPLGSSVDLLRLRLSVDAAEALLSAGDAAAALSQAEAELELASQEVLPGGGEEWVEGLRAEVDDLRARLELVAIQAALAMDAPARAATLAQNLLDRTPLREDAHRLLIRALWHADRRAEALAAYHRCRVLLDEALGAYPAESTQALFLEILAAEGDSHAVTEYARDTPSGAPAVLTALAAETPFVGRHGLLSKLLGRARLVAQAGLFVSCLHGEAGIGKTRLAAELAAACQGAGVNVLYGRAEDRVAVPYGSLIDALERSHGTAAVASLLAHAPVGTAILAALRDLASQAATLLVLDDMQWASRAEIEVLEKLLADPEATRALVLVLHRSSEDPACLQQLGASPRILRAELAPLTRDQVAALSRLTPLADAVGSGAERSVAVIDDVWRASGGNPLLASELLTDGQAGEPGRVPELVRRLVDERLRRLPADAADVLALAAVAGLEFDPALVAVTTTEESATVMAQLQAAREVGLLVAGEGSQLAFRHGLVRDALLARLAAGERAALHGQLGRRLQERDWLSESDRVGVAYHLASAGPVADLSRALRYWLPVARQAYVTGIYEDVITVTERALAAISDGRDGPGSADGDQLADAELELTVLLGGAQRALGDPDGQETLGRAFDAARQAGKPGWMADAALALTPPATFSEAAFLDEYQQTRYAEALAALESDGDQQAARKAQLMARLAAGLSWGQSLTAGRQLAEQAEALARRLGDPRTMATVIATLRRAVPGCSDTALMQRLENEAAALAEQLGDSELAVGAALWRYASAVQRGEGQQLEQLLQEAGEKARGQRAASLHHSIAFEHAALALLRGRLGEAELLVQRAAELGRERGVDPTVVEVLRLTQMLAVRGEQHRLAELRDEIEPLFDHAGISSWRSSIGIIDAACGVHEGVAERIDPVIAEFEQRGPTILCPESVVAYLTPPALALGEPERAQRILTLIRPVSGQGAYFGVFAGPIDYYIGLLERFLGEQERASQSLMAAAAFCERLGAPRWLARCQEALLVSD